MGASDQANPTGVVDWPPFEVCRDENCKVEELHPAHRIKKGGRGPDKQPRKKAGKQ